MGSTISGLVFQPPTPTYFGTSRRYFSIKSPLGHDIPAFYIDHQAPVTVLFCHGNAEDLGMIYDWFEELGFHLNANVMAFDYRGYGQSTISVPTEAGCYEDVEAAFAYLVDEKGCTPDRIILYGRSLGSGPTCFLAQKQSLANAPVMGVILQSPLLSAYRVAFHFRFTLPGDIFPNIDRVADISSPVLFIHGTRDEIVPFWHGQELFLRCRPAVRAKPFWIDGAGHNNLEALLRERGVFFNRLIEFVNVSCGRNMWVASGSSPASPRSAPAPATPAPKGRTLYSKVATADQVGLD